MTGTIYVQISAVKGSAPRNAGTQMAVTTDAQTGTIGGGALEWEACRIARDMLARNVATQNLTIPLGPNLGQCCGGSVTLAFSTVPLVVPSDAAPVWIWGAGHVGRAIAQVFAPLTQFDVTLIDDHHDRLPDPLPLSISPVVAARMPDLVPHAPQDAHHLIMTYAHPTDLALCDALLRHGFASAGVIGSATKWARFRRKLTHLGHDDTDIARISCPIGDPRLGKHPQAIAIGVASSFLLHNQTRPLEGQQA